MFLLLLTGVLCGPYKYKLQQLVNKGVDISNQQCKVFASLKKQNNLFRESIQIEPISSNKDKYLKKLDEYYKTAKISVAEQEKWLSTQKEFMNRLDYKFLLPTSIQELGVLRYEYWKKDNDAESALIESYNVYQLNETLANNLALKSQKLSQERDSIQEKIDLTLKKYEGNPDWRMKFIKVPQSKC